MAEKNDSCGCNCCLSPVVQETMQQTASRFNERAAYANTNQMDNQTLLLSMFQAQAQNSLETTPQTDLTALMGQVGGLVKTGLTAGA